jgi:mannosyltransferase OCH1-like enzyme
MIEKKIFQTYKKEYSELDDYAIYTSKTWIDKNPDWEYNYFSDESILDFTNDVYGKEWLDILLNRCPVGVMKSDIWRHLAVYNYGGIYADLDTICTDSINNWGINMNKEAVFSWGIDNLIVSHTFAGEAKSKVFEHILYNIQKAVYENKEFSIDYVYKTTGPEIFTRSLLEYLQNNNNIDILEDIYFFTSNKVVHLNASRYWNFDSYDSWNKELESILNEII